MGHHTFNSDQADRLEGEGRFRYLSAEELRWALDLTGTETIADLGSGTGFFTDIVAPDAGEVYAVDLQSEMHDYYRDKGVPENVELVTSDVTDVPFDDDALDAAFATMTYHEFASEAALAEVARVLGPDGRLVVVDWAADGEGANGPPLEERYSLDDAIEALRDAGFTIGFDAQRPETFFLVATR